MKPASGGGGNSAKRLHAICPRCALVLNERAILTPNIKVKQ